MSWYPYNPNLGQKMQTQINGVNIDRGFVAHFQVTAEKAIAASNDGVHSAIDASADTTVEVTTNITNPGVPRNITVTAGGTGGDIKAGTQVTITGTNYNDEVITEDLPAFEADTPATKEGSKAFKTVTKISVPSMDGAGVEITVGWGDKLGLPYKLSHNTCLFAFLDNVLEGTDPTITTDASNLEANTIDLNSALDGSVVDVYFIV